jgi:hypothetical protein
MKALASMDALVMLRQDLVSVCLGTWRNVVVVSG